MATLIGKVGMVMKGDYNSANTYEALDAVSYNNGLYIAKQAVPANTAPTNTTYWQKAVGNEAATRTQLASYKTPLVTAGSAVLIKSANSCTITGSISFPALEANDVLYDLSEILDFSINDTYHCIGFNSSGNYFRLRLGSDKKLTSYGANSAGNYVAFTLTFTY